ncbi:MAG: hypothetical protein NC388_10665 [Clostridium sp.]|nr:hypothetical protein [Clostridium sp.]
MKTKYFATLLGLAAATVPACAQYEGTKFDDRIGHGQDSIDVRQNMSLFQQFIGQQDYKSAYDPWKVVFTKAPFAQVSIYAYGVYIVSVMLEQETDVAKKKEYFDELMGIYDTRIKNLDGLNSFTRADKQVTAGEILARKAFDYARYAPGLDKEYSLDKTYDMFRHSIDMVKESGAKEIEGFVLDMFIAVSYEKYKLDNNGFREQFLTDYLEGREVCETMLEKARTATSEAQAQKIISQYDPTLAHIEALFVESKAADREQILAIFGPKVEANKDNLAYLKSALQLMSANDCDDSDIYYKAAEYAYKIEPSYESAIGTAQKYNKEGKTAESIQYYDKALELCKTTENKASISIKIANALAKSGDVSKAYGYLDKAEGFNPDVAGKCNFIRAQLLTTEHKFGEAIAMCDKATQADISLSGAAGRLKSKIQEVQRKNAEYQKANAEYQAEKAKRDREEEFWKAGKQ